MSEIVFIICIGTSVLAGFSALIFQSTVRALSASLTALIAMGIALLAYDHTQSGLFLWLGPIGLSSLLWTALLLNLTKAERGERRRSLRRGIMLVVLFFIGAPVASVLNEVFLDTLPTVSAHVLPAQSLSPSIVIVAIFTLCVSALLSLVIARRSP